MLLHDINVDRIEVASARESEGEKDAVARICRYAKTIGKLDSVVVLGFVDNNKSILAIINFSWGRKLTPLVCSPSRSVQSMISISLMRELSLFALTFIITCF